MTLDETIHFSEYNINWQTQFEQEKVILLTIFPKNNFKDIQHIGSTSVKGMYAKPIIDIMIGLEKLFIDENTDNKLKINKYLGFGEAGVKGRLYYRKREIRFINLAIVEWESDVWKNNITLREYLRTHAEEVKNYSQKKKDIHNAGINTLLKYSSEKNEFMIILLEKAKEWASK